MHVKLLYLTTCLLICRYYDCQKLLSEPSDVVAWNEQIYISDFKVLLLLILKAQLSAQN